MERTMNNNTGENGERSVTLQWCSREQSKTTASRFYAKLFDKYNNSPLIQRGLLSCCIFSLRNKSLIPVINCRTLYSRRRNWVFVDSSVTDVDMRYYSYMRYYGGINRDGWNLMRFYLWWVTSSIINCMVVTSSHSTDNLDSCGSLPVGFETGDCERRETTIASVDTVQTNAILATS